MSEYIGLPKATLDAAFTLLGNLPASQSRGVMNAIEAQGFHCEAPKAPEIPASQIVGEEKEEGKK